MLPCCKESADLRSILSDIIITILVCKHFLWHVCRLRHAHANICVCTRVFRASCVRIVRNLVRVGSCVRIAQLSRPVGPALAAVAAHPSLLTWHIALSHGTHCAHTRHALRPDTARTAPTHTVRTAPTHTARTAPHSHLLCT